MKDMKEIVKNPNVYYVAAPVAAALFTLLAALVFYPGAITRWQDSESEFKEVQTKAEELLKLQPERLVFKVDEKNTAQTFDFTVVINDFAKVFGISHTNYTVSVKGEVKKQGKRARSATVSIKTIDIEKLCTFLSTMLAYWPDLECDVLSLDKGKAGKDDWKADITLTYFY
jgi:hypothetical protein